MSKKKHEERDPEQAIVTDHYLDLATRRRQKKQPPLKFPAHWRDVTAEHVGETIIMRSAAMRPDGTLDPGSITIIDPAESTKAPPAGATERQREDDGK